MKIRGRLLGVCLGVVCLSGAWGQQYTIKTIAGNGTLGNSGTGDAASSQLNSPGAVVLGPNGDIYIADTGNHCIRKISGTQISTIAGTCGTIGQSGEGQSPTAATLNAPSGLAFDSTGNLYIADTGNSVIRKITGTTITRVAGQYNQAGYGGDNGVAITSNLNGPTAVAVDPGGNLYIADTNNNLIRKVDTKTGIITPYVGAGSITGGRIKSPNGLWFDATGALYIANSALDSVSKYVAPTLSLFAGNQTAGSSGDGGQALRAQLDKPSGVMGDGTGNIFIADTNSNRIRKVAADGTITTIAGRGPGPYGGDGGIATDAFLSFPRSIAVSSNGTIYIADTGNHAIRVLTPTASTINISGVTNAASFVTRISPGALATIFGTGLANSTFQADDGFNWPTTAKGVNVRVNGVNAPLYYVSPGQINFQVPWATPTSGTVNVSVLFNGGASNTVTVPAATAAPGLFYLPGGAAIVQNTPDYTLNDPSNPAAKGSTVIAYLTGSGPLSVAQKDGVPASLTALVSATSAVTATIGSAPATVSFAGLTPGYIGLMQMNIVVPTTLAAGVYQLAITIDGQAANTATIAVK